MRLLSLISITSLAALLMAGCKTDNPVTAVDNTGNTGLGKTITITAITADPDTVPFGQNSVIVCKTTINGDSTLSNQLNYEWSATGAYGYLNPQGSYCIFYSPGCHYGFAQVMVTVSDDLGNSVSDTVDINPMMR